MARLAPCWLWRLALLVTLGAFVFAVSAADAGAATAKKPRAIVKLPIPPGGGITLAASTVTVKGSRLPRKLKLRVGVVRPRRMPSSSVVVAGITRKGKPKPRAATFRIAWAIINRATRTARGAGTSDFSDLYVNRAPFPRGIRHRRPQLQQVGARTPTVVSFEPLGTALDSAQRASCGALFSTFAVAADDDAPGGIVRFVLDNEKFPWMVPAKVSISGAFDAACPGMGLSGGAAVVREATGIDAECTNGRDDDADGQTDFPMDLGCAIWADDQEDEAPVGGPPSGPPSDPGRPDTKTCVGPSQTCVETESACSQGASCAGDRSTCTDPGTVCSGSASECTDGADCNGQMSICMDPGTDCNGQDSECSAGATCHGAGSTCSDYTSTCLASNSTCNTGAACPGNTTVHFTSPRPSTIRGMGSSETITSGFTDQVADFLEIEVPAPYEIFGFFAKSSGPCVLIATDGTEIAPDPGSDPPTYTVPAGKVVRKLRCPGKSSREVEFHLTLNTRPAEGTTITVRALKGGGVADTSNSSVPGA